MILYPNAKINLGLSVLTKREDGFHNLETLFYPVEARDVLEIVESNGLTMHQYGIEYPGDPMDNLCVKAYKVLKEDFDIPPVDIHLYKKIPVIHNVTVPTKTSFVTTQLSLIINTNISHNLQSPFLI